jgi:hypothetical protein
VLRLSLRAIPWSARPGTLYFQSGREAFLALLRAIPHDHSRTVLLPAYVPEGLYAPVIAAGWRVQMYPIGADFSPDWEELSVLLDQCKPAVAVLVHHFGVPQDCERFTRLCRDAGTLSMEDHAHVAALPGGELGSKADIVLTSLPKLFGVPDGAELSLAAPLASKLSVSVDKLNAGLLYVTLQMCTLVFGSLASLLPPRSAGLVGKVSSRLFRSYPVLMAGFTIVRPMSKLSKFLLDHTDRIDEAQRRIERAELYAAYLDRDVFQHSLSYVPKMHGLFAYPVLVGNREGLIKHLARSGIAGTVLASRWDFRAEAGYVMERSASSTSIFSFLLPENCRSRM